MPVWILTAWSFLKRVPWPVWAAIGILFAGWLYGNHRYSAGRESVLVELRKAEAEAAAESFAARNEADAEAQERAETFEKKQETLREVIDHAESTGSNPVDDLISMWPQD